MIHTSGFFFNLDIAPSQIEIRAVNSHALPLIICETASVETKPYPQLKYL